MPFYALKGRFGNKREHKKKQKLRFVTMFQE